MHVVYILFSPTLNKFYIGYTADLKERMNKHLFPEETRKYTAKARDWELFFELNCESKQQGLAIEKHLKSMKSKCYLLNLVKHPEISERLLLRYRC